MKASNPLHVKARRSVSTLVALATMFFVECQGTANPLFAQGKTIPKQRFYEGSLPGYDVEIVICREYKPPYRSVDLTANQPWIVPQRVIAYAALSDNRWKVIHVIWHPGQDITGPFDRVEGNKLYPYFPPAATCGSKGNPITGENPYPKRKPIPLNTIHLEALLNTAVHQIENPKHWVKTE